MSEASGAPAMTPLLVGEGTFADDLQPEGQAFGVFVRSPHPHARIRSIKFDDAVAAAGVVGVLTGRDVEEAGVGSISRPPPQMGRNGPLVAPHRPALAKDRVVHVGEAVALVVAETKSAAEDAAELIAVEYEALPSVSGATEALRSDAPQIWSDAPGNLALDWNAAGEHGDSRRAEIDRIMAGAAHVVRVRSVNQRLAGVPMEPRSATASYDPASERFTLHVPTQGVGPMRHELAAILGVDGSRIRVLSDNVGGAFGLKTPPYPEYPALMLAARRFGRAVHWTSTRSEAFQTDHQGRDNIADASLALDEEGRFLALSVSAVVDLGAYVTQAGAIIASIGFANCFPTVYDIAYVAVGVKLAFTNTVPTGPYRGAGRPEANFVMERLVDAAARKTGIDPLQIRRRNMVPAGAMPYRSATGNVYDSGDFLSALEKAAEMARVSAFKVRREEAAKSGRRRGLGVSCFLEHAGAIPDEGAILSLVGDQVEVFVGVQDSGQGQAAVFAKLAADRLGIPAERVVVRQGDSDRAIRGGPAVGSRSSAAVGFAVVQGVSDFVEAGRALAADMLEVSPGDVEYAAGWFAVAGTDRRVSLFDLGSARGGFATHAQVKTTLTFPNGCHIAEVEIDPETGAVEVVSYVAVDDCGVVLDHVRADAQVMGGVAQGLGQALLERVAYDPDGQLLTGSLLDYALPRATDVPSLKSAFSEVPSTTNPLGVKGIGEAGTTAAIAAIMNAIDDALPFGRAGSVDMPATPEKIWRAMRE